MRGFWCQALPSPGCPFLGAGSRATLPVFLGRGWGGCGGPAPAPQRALLQAGVARCGVGGRASPGGRGRAPRRCEGAAGVRRSPSPGCPSVGRVAGAAAHFLWERVCGFGCAARPWGGRLSVDVRGVRGVSVVSVCLCGCVVVRCVPRYRGAGCCLSSPVAPVPPSRPLSLVLLCVPWFRGLWLCALSCVCPSVLHVPCLAGAVPSFCFPCFGVFYPFLYPLLVGPPPWGARFPASLASLCVASSFPLSTSLVSCSSLLSVATASCLLFRGPVRHGMDRGVGCCGGGGHDDACNYDHAIVDGDVYAVAVAVSLWPT